MLTLILTGVRIIQAGAASVRHAPEIRFSGRRPRRRGADALTAGRAREQVLQSEALGG